jgi:carboxypeptidase family protein
MRASVAVALLWAATLGAQQQQQPAGSTLASAVGIVVDSVHGGPLTGALVVVEGTDAQATVDEHGRFRIDSIPPGSHQLGVFHPLLDSLGVAVGTGNLTFGSGTATSIVLATPSLPSVIALYCSESEREHGAGAIIGKVLLADSDDPVSGATVRFTWRGYGRPQTLDAAVTTAGDFRLCGVPLGARGTIRAERGGAVTGNMPAEVASRPLAIVPLHLPRARGNANAGGAVVSGRIVDVHGIPVPGVDVVFDSVTRTLSGDSGGFTLRGLASGSTTLQFRKVGFQATDIAVELSASKPASLAVTLNPAPPVLATVDVTATRQKALDRVGFTSRERSSAGLFLDSDAIAKRNAIVFSDLARTVSGLHVVLRKGQPVVTQPLGESVSGNGCVLFELDGNAFEDDPPGAIDAHVPPSSIIAMEVYHPGAAPLQVLQDATPGDFGVAQPTNLTSNSARLQTAGTVPGGSVSATACTVVVIWTKATSKGE